MRSWIAYGLVRTAIRLVGINVVWNAVRHAMLADIIQRQGEELLSRPKVK